MAKKRSRNKAAVPGSEWNKDVLKEYKITVKETDKADFYKFSDEHINFNEDFKIDSLNQDIFEETSTNGDIQDLLGYMRLAALGRSQESAVDDFAAKLLQVLEYKTFNQLIRTRNVIRLKMKNEDTSAQTDISIVESGTILMLLQEDKTERGDRLCAEAQIIAEAIAAYQHNSEEFESLSNVVYPDKYVFPCITMVGTYPVFYKIPITKTLSECVEKGTTPKEETIVFRCNPKEIDQPLTTGMLLKKDRKIIVKHFLAFKQIYRKSLGQIKYLQKHKGEVLSNFDRLLVP